MKLDSADTSKLTDLDRERNWAQGVVCGEEKQEKVGDSKTNQREREKRTSDVTLTTKRKCTWCSELLSKVCSPCREDMHGESNPNIHSIFF